MSRATRIAAALSLCGVASAQIAIESRTEEAEPAYRHGIEVARRHLEGQPDDTRAWYLGAGALMALGRTTEGIEWAEKARSIDPTDSMLLFNLAGIYALGGSA